MYHMDFIIVITEGVLFTGEGGKLSIFLKLQLS